MADADVKQSGIEPATPAIDEFDFATRLIQLALAVCGIAALVSSRFAGNYRSADHTGFSIRRWCGIAILHVGAVMLHALGGHDPWQRMFFATHAGGKRQ
jgi:hypothetical protein